MMTPTDLQAAISAAPDNSEIEVPDGQWGDIQVQKKTGLKLLGGPGAVFRSLNVNASPGIELNGFGVTYMPDAKTTTNSDALRVYNSPNPTIRNLVLKGLPVGADIVGAQDPAAIPPPTMNALLVGWPAARGLDVGSCDGVLIEGLDTSGFFTGGNISNCNDVVVQDCKSYGLRGSHWRGFIPKNGLFQRIHMLGSHPYRYANDTQGDHSDGIHLFPPDDLSVQDAIHLLDCFFDQAGGYASQTAYNLQGHYTNALVQRCTAIVDYTQGMTLGGKSSGIDGSILDNTMISNPTAKLWPTFILYGDTSDLVMTGNNAADLSTKPKLADRYPTNTWQPRATTKQADVDAARAQALARLTPPTVATPTPVVTDPRDAQITDLQAQLKAANDSGATSANMASELQDQVDGLTKQLAAANALVTTAQGQIAAAAKALGLGS